jgi:SAM-dependent methyltransferase
LEPNPGVIRLAEQQRRQRRQTKLNAEYLDLPGERIPLPNASIDTLVSTFILCTIPGAVEAIRGIGRVLRPGGKVIFFEHGLSPDLHVQRWQKWSEPIPHWLFEGCHVTRDIPSLITTGNFKLSRWKGRTSRRPRSRGPIVSGAPRFYDLNSARLAGSNVGRR